MTVHAVDIECHGFAAGVRGSGLRVDAFHFSVIAMIQRFDDGQPAFLYGNSMGCMVLNTFLLKNPDLKIAGVIFSAPFFGFSEKLGVNWFKTLLMKVSAPLIKVSLSNNLQDIAFNSPIKIHSVSQNKSYLHRLLNDRKSIPFVNVDAALSLMKGTQNL